MTDEELMERTMRLMQSADDDTLVILIELTKRWFKLREPATTGEAAKPNTQEINRAPAKKTVSKNDLEPGSWYKRVCTVMMTDGYYGRFPCGATLDGNNRCHKHGVQNMFDLVKVNK